MSLTPNPNGKPGKDRPAASAFLIQGPPLWSFTQESLEKLKPSAQQAGSWTCPQRVPHGRFFGASSVASVLDLRARARPRGERFHVITLRPTAIGKNLGLRLHHAVE
jgi:hypothetical protein